MTNNDQRPPEPPPAPENEPRGEDSSSPKPPTGQPVTLQPNTNDLRGLKTSQTLVMISSVAGPVSLFIGGVLLSAVGLVCGIVAFRKLVALAARQTNVAAVASRLKRSAIVGMAVCSVAFVLNAIAFYLMLPVVMDMVASGDYTGLMTDAGTGAVGPNSTWG